MILYKIGKVCAINRIYLRHGLLSLKDFNQMIKFENNKIINRDYEKCKIKGKFWEILIYIQLNDYR